MAPKSAAAPRGPGRGTNLTIAFGLVNVGVKYAPLVKSDSGRAKAKTCCRTHGAPVQSEYRCTHGKELVEAGDKAMAYDVGGTYVEVDTGELGLERDPRLDLVSAVDVASIDPLYFEKAYAVWPSAGHEQAYDLLVAIVRTSGKALVGTTVLAKSTRAVVIRWSDAAECLLAHTCTYDARIAWNDVRLVAHGTAAAPELPAALVDAGTTLFSALEPEFAFGDVVDEYGAQLDDVLAALRAGKTPAPAPAPAEAAAPVGDLMAALTASVAAAKPKTKPQKPKRPKAAA